MLFHRLFGWARGQPGSFLASDLGDEVEAFLHGRYLERLRARRETAQIRPWMWLNAVAHGSHASVVELAGDGTAPAAGGSLGWAEARALIARDVLDCSGSSEPELARLQRFVLVPIELRLWSSPTMSPAEVAEQVGGELRGAQY